MGIRTMNKKKIKIVLIDIILVSLAESICISYLADFIDNKISGNTFIKFKAVLITVLVINSIYGIFKLRKLNDV